MQPPHIIYIFIDGIGLGKNNKQINPFSKFHSPFLSILGGSQNSFQVPGIFLNLDAHMGVSGLPQSATGQTCLFTGIDVLKIMKRHITGFPTYTLKKYLNHYSIIKKFKEKDLNATLLNSYTDWYLNKISGKGGSRWLSATSLIQQSSGQKLFTLDDYKRGESLYMDITNWLLRSLGKPFPLISPKETGKKIVELSKKYHLVLYEYFFTDKCGHKQSMGGAKRIIQHLSLFLEAIWENISTENQLVIISSDHGNMEDLSTKSHTHNHVPAIIYGKQQEQFTSMKYLYDIPRAIYNLYKIPFHNQLIH